MPFLPPDKLKAFGHAGGIGFEMVALLLVGVFGGRWIDQQLGTDPTFKLLGVLFGIGAGFYNLFKLARRMSRSKPDVAADDVARDDEATLGNEGDGAPEASRGRPKNDDTDER